MQKDQETEKLIKDTARDIFFKEGKFNATTQEIADAAGVNRTLINYYFRSRQNLFDLLFEEALEKEEQIRDQILFSKVPFQEKIERYLDEALSKSRRFPYLESYIVSKLNEGHSYRKEEDWKRFLKLFKEEYRAEVKKGNVVKMSPVHFLLNLWSLISFPFAIQPLFQSLMKISDEEYEQLIEERKEIIIQLLFISK